MSRGRETEDKEVEEKEMEGNEFDDDEYEDEFDEDEEEYEMESVLHEPSEAIINSSDRILSDGQLPRKIRKCDSNWCLNRHQMLSSFGHGKLDLPFDPQDADYYLSPQLSEDLETMILPRIPIELETMILARIGILEFRKLCRLNKNFLARIKNGEMLKERKLNGAQEASVFMLATGEHNWWAFDNKFSTRKALPVLPCDDDDAFNFSDKESLCAGTHLLVCGIEVDGPVIWTYDLIMNKWFKGSPMHEARCLFASASCGDFAYVAGGISLKGNRILNSAEKYDPVTKTWDPLPKMKEKRKMCSGVYMDNKFYVIGGQNHNGDAFTCGEVFLEDKIMWKPIPGMLNGLTLGSSQSPPLLAVVNNELYLFEPSSNRLKVYLKGSISWKDLGLVPVRADLNKGWGVAFKSLGDKLLVIGGTTSTVSLSGRGMTIYTCCPDPNAEKLDWERIDGGNNKSPFILNCAVMVA